MRQKADETKRPNDRDKAVSVAYLRILGASQEVAGDAVGVSRDTIGRWEACSWWADILADASARWLAGLEAKARKVLLEGMDPTLALKILERRFKELAPPTLRTDITSDDKPLPHAVEIHLIDPPQDDQEGE